MVTGISPQHAESNGVVEAEFAAAINAELSRPGTCGVGYNSMRFDDEVTRNLFYRNFIDPYAREWQNGNSRWDLIDTVRLAHALRPEGIEWPRRDDGATSFRLEQLTAANGIEHGDAHDALSDVRATIALARLVRDRQPRLFDYALTLRAKQRADALLSRSESLLHVSARYPAELGCIAPIATVTRHPRNANGVIVLDLRADPRVLVDLSVEELRERLFTRSADLPDGVERVPLKTVHINRAPVLAPMKTLTSEAAERWQIDLGLVAQRAQWLAQARPALAEKIQHVHQAPEGPEPTDPDLMIYSGGFFSDGDRRLMEAVRRSRPDELVESSFPFADERLPEMLFRYRARNWPDSLSDDELERWDAYRLDRLLDPGGGGSIQIDGFEARITELLEQPGLDEKKRALLLDLLAWGERVMDAGA